MRIVCKSLVDEMAKPNADIKIILLIIQFFKEIANSFGDTGKWVIGVCLTEKQGGEKILYLFFSC